MADALRSGGRADEAVLLVREALTQLERCYPLAMYLGQVWWIAYQVLAAAGHTDEAVAALQAGRSWVLHDALPHVPVEYRESFLTGNLTNRSLLAQAQETGVGARG
ncbi:MAG: hypothetical protein H7Z19_21890 [Chitinophagaceae bacterium]|nr:hypothetical protein [Rubrivivax sp.]